MKFLVLTLLYSFTVLACQKSEVCKKMQLDIDLIGSVNFGEVVPVELCNQSKQCERTEDFISSKTKSNCSMALEIEMNDGTIKKSYLKSDKMHNYISNRFRYGPENLYKSYPLGMYKMRKPAKIDDSYACIPIDLKKAKEIKVKFDQRPVHCIGKNNKSDTSSYKSEFVERSTVCKKEFSAKLNPSYLETQCALIKKELKAQYNVKVRTLAQSISDKMIESAANPSSVAVQNSFSESANELIKKLAVGLGLSATHNTADGLGLVIASKEYQEIRDNLKQPCEVDVCVDCSLKND